MNNTPHRLNLDRRKRLAYMQAMEIPMWLPREIAQPEASKASHKVTADPHFAEIMAQLEGKPSARVKPKTAVRPPNPAGFRSPSHVIATNTSNKTQTLENKQIARLDWQALQTAVSGCQRCELHKTRIQTVFGVGNENPECLVIGEAPGSEEDKQGEPFVGRAGKLLDQMLLAMGLERSVVYIANTLKCRPPYNRDPKVDETANCRPYLERQIELLQPKVILVVGRIAAQNLLQNKTSLARLRGRVHYLPLDGTPVVVTYHPAYLLRYPQDKRKTWQDLQLAMQTLRDEQKQTLL